MSLTGPNDIPESPSQLPDLCEQDNLIRALGLAIGSYNKPSSKTGSNSNATESDIAATATVTSTAPPCATATGPGWHMTYDHNTQDTHAQSQSHWHQESRGPGPDFTGAASPGHPNRNKENSYYGSPGHIVEKRMGSKTSTIATGPGDGETLSLDNTTISLTSLQDDEIDYELSGPNQGHIQKRVIVSSNTNFQDVDCEGPSQNFQDLSNSFNECGPGQHSESVSVFSAPSGLYSNLTSNMQSSFYGGPGQNQMKMHQDQQGYNQNLVSGGYYETGHDSTPGHGHAGHPSVSNLSNKKQLTLNQTLNQTMSIDSRLSSRTYGRGFGINNSETMNADTNTNRSMNLSQSNLHNVYVDDNGQPLPDQLHFQSESQSQFGTGQDINSNFGGPTNQTGGFLFGGASVDSLSPEDTDGESNLKPQEKTSMLTSEMVSCWDSNTIRPVSRGVTEPLTDDEQMRTLTDDEQPSLRVESESIVYESDAEKRPRRN